MTGADAEDVLCGGGGVGVLSGGDGDGELDAQGGGDLRAGDPEWWESRRRRLEAVARGGTGPDHTIG